MQSPGAKALTTNGGRHDNLSRRGVDIEAANRAVDLMKSAVRGTYSDAVLTDVGSFGGLFALEGLPARPVLVASTDGVGTKVKLAALAGAWEGIGQDIVNHCVNDILVQGARPLFFLDYIASSRLEPEQVAATVTGMAEACRAVGCALLGGETAEMPGVYAPGAFDVAGTIVGLVDRSAILPRTQEMVAGDLLIGLPSSGPHTNGFSLIRQIIDGRSLAEPVPGSDQPLGEALLAPHRCYVTELDRLRGAGLLPKGLAHITGGGFLDNIPRILPNHLGARVDRSSWQLPPLFQALMTWGNLDVLEAYRVFNMGMGMVLVVDAGQADRVLEVLPAARVIGELVPAGGERVRI